MDNKKGFTLVELLAVIVILALLIVITANTVLPMMNKTKNRAMVVYAEKVLDKASAAYVIDNMTNGGSAEYYSIEQLMGQDDYYGVVKVEMNNGVEYLYNIAMFDSKEELGLKIKDLKSSIIEGNIDAFIKSSYYTSDDTEDKYDTDEECEEYDFFKNINLININNFKQYGSIRKYVDFYLVPGTYSYSSNLHSKSGIAFYTGIRNNDNYETTNSIKMFSPFTGTQDNGEFTISEANTYRFLIYCNNVDNFKVLENSWNNIWIQIEKE